MALVASVLALVVGSWWIVRADTTPVRITRSAPSSSEGADRSRSLLTTSPTPTAAAVSAPRELVLVSARVRLPVVPVGVAADGQMQLPDDPADVGWYRYGPAPGASRGSAVLAGHVDSVRYGVGPLARLRGLRRGDVVTVRTRAADLRFRVISTEVVAKSNVALSQVFARTGRPVLRIVTCGGAYIRARGGYQDNVVVTAERR